ncbi:MAG: deoxyguanosinetriphosphate triphosphohydrolase, partial [Brevinematales bacterium]
SEFRKTKKILQELYSYYLEHIDEISKTIPPGKKSDKHRIVCDFIAGMTDRFALSTYERLFLPQG